MQVAKAYHACKGRRVFLLDYGGTLIGREASNLAFKSNFQVAAGVGRVPSRTEAALAKMCASPRDSVFVISGARRGKLNSALGHVDGLGLAAENGSMYSWAVGKAEDAAGLDATDASTSGATVGSETSSATAVDGGEPKTRGRRAASYSNALVSSDLARRRKGAVHVVVRSGKGLKDSSTWWSVGEQSPYVRATLTLQPLRNNASAHAVRVVHGVPTDSAVAAATASTKPCKRGGTEPIFTVKEHDSDLALNMDLGGSAKLPSSVIVQIEVMNKNMVQADALIGRAMVQLPLLVGSEAPQELSVELDTGGTVQCSMYFVNDDEDTAATMMAAAAAKRNHDHGEITATTAATSATPTSGPGECPRLSNVGAEQNDGRVWQQMESDFAWGPVCAAFCCSM